MPRSSHKNILAKRICCNSMVNSQIRRSFVQRTYQIAQLIKYFITRWFSNFLCIFNHRSNSGIANLMAIETNLLKLSDKVPDFIPKL